MEGCLTDVRYIDLGETGRAVADKLHLSRNSAVVCMCQHRKNSQIFASCHAETVNIWSWFGTDRYECDKSAVICDSMFIRDSTRIMYGMAFLSDVPEWISAQDGHVLFLLSGQPQRPWLTITVVAAFQTTHSVLLERNIGLDGSLLEAARTGQINFQISHSDRILIVAGRGATHFFEIGRVAPSEQGSDETELTLSLIKDPQLEEEGLNCLDISACLCIPPPKICGAMGALDWIILSDNDGDLYGFLWTEDGSSNKVTLSKHHGRFSSQQKKHDSGVPVSLLIPTFGATANCHYRSVKEKGFSYTHFLEGMTYERDRFFSCGDDGKLLSWNLGKSGWISHIEDGINEHLEGGQPNYVEGGRQFACAQSSRLVPHVLVAMDQNRKLICFDTTSMNTEPTPLEAMCCLGGA